MQKFLEGLNPTIRKFIRTNLDMKTPDSILYDLECYNLVNKKDIYRYFELTDQEINWDKVVLKALGEQYNVVIEESSPTTLTVYHSPFNKSDLSDLQFSISRDYDHKLINLVKVSPYSLKLKEVSPVLQFKRLLLECREMGATDLYLAVVADLDTMGFKVDCTARKDLIKIPLGSLQLSVDELNQLVLSVVRKMVNRSEMDLETTVGIRGDIYDPLNDESLSLRYTFMKAQFGYKATFRLHPIHQKLQTMDNLNIQEDTKEAMNLVLKRRSGITLITGPMGSGKTNLITAALSTLFGTGKEIVEVSYPIEIRLPVPQINYKGNIESLNEIISMLRMQAVDIALVNEINHADVAKAVVDLVTSKVHVVTSLHLSRVYYLGHKLESFLGTSYKDIIPHLNLCLTQQLVGKICPNCKTESSVENLPPMLYQKLHTYGYELSHFYYARGCESCNSTGVKGLHPFSESIIFDTEMVDTLMGVSSSYEMQKYLFNKMSENKSLLEYKIVEGISKGLIPVDTLLEIV